MTKWFLLAGAVGSEVIASLSLKAALTHPALYAVVLLGYVSAFTFLTLVLKRGMALGVAYGIWGALGVAATAVLSAVLFDEFHERSLDADLALALTLNARQLLRDEPLKLLLMSATLEGQRLSALLDEAPVVRSEGRMHPVEQRWGRPLAPGERIEPRVVQTVLQALQDERGSVLVFLPGQAEIRRVNEALAEQLEGRGDILLCPLHGELELAQQRAAIEPAPAGLRKVSA